jgi:hypothetical protein
LLSAFTLEANAGTAGAASRSNRLQPC